MCASLTGLFHLAQSPESSSVLSHLARFTFLRLPNIPGHVQTTLSLSAHPLMDT